MVAVALPTNPYHLRGCRVRLQGTDWTRRELARMIGDVGDDLTADLVLGSDGTAVVLRGKVRYIWAVLHVLPVYPEDRERVRRELTAAGFKVPLRPERIDGMMW